MGSQNQLSWTSKELSGKLIDAVNKEEKKVSREQVYSKGNLLKTGKILQFNLYT
jgi:hypothetical protein